ncbi:hypothetical protein JXQ70_20160 [bacterium]|nr:hypothetical protein [bacterium]
MNLLRVLFFIIFFLVAVKLLFLVGFFLKLVISVLMIGAVIWLISLFFKSPET